MRRVCGIGAPATHEKLEPANENSTNYNIIHSSPQQQKRQQQ
jgi:hypothetical protein